MDNLHGDVDEFGEILDELDHEEALCRLYELRDRYAEAVDQVGHQQGVEELLRRWEAWWSERGYDPHRPGPWVYVPGLSH